MIAPQVHVVSTNFIVILVCNKQCCGSWMCLPDLDPDFLLPVFRIQVSKITGSRIRSTEQRHLALHMMGNANLIQLPCRLVTSMLALASRGSIRQPKYYPATMQVTSLCTFLNIWAFATVYIPEHLRICNSVVDPKIFPAPDALIRYLKNFLFWLKN